MKQNLRVLQEKVLKALSGKIDDFYLGGGTALSFYYFKHRESLDLDFFTPHFSQKRVQEIVRHISLALKKKIRLSAQQLHKTMAKIMVYYLYSEGQKLLKMDFVEDYIGLIKPPSEINGIRVMALEDIYMRKIHTIAGTSQEQDITGRFIAKGGREEARDFYDVYCLSTIFMSLSDFSFKYCKQFVREGLIRWFRAYDRMNIMTGLLELKTKKKIDYREIDRHFKIEIDKILKKEVNLI